MFPLLAAAAPAATKALLVAGGTAVGGVLGKAAAQGVVDAVQGVGQAINSFGQPQGAGQQRMMIMAGQPTATSNTQIQMPSFY
jgi:hypothetical protein